MKQLIDGKLYDTETAEELCANSSSSAFSHTTISLYKTQKASFFTHSRTKYSTDVAEANDIKVLKDKEAKEFYAKHGGDIANWPSVFGEEVEQG